MEHDVLIVGGRVAGSSLALLLARRGFRVLVVDRDVFPSDTLSTHCLSFYAVRSLAKLGVLAEVEAAGFRRIVRHRTWVEDCCLEAPAGPQGTYSLAPRREVLDGVLLAAARGAGAEVEQRTTLEDLVQEDGKVVGARLRTPAGSREVRASVVVGADGRHSTVAERVGARKYDSVPPLRPVFYGYYRGIAPREETTLEMWFGRDQIGFLFPMRPSEDCVVLEIQAEDFDAFRGDPRAALEGRFRALPGMGDRFRGATLDGRIMATRGIENYFRTPYGPGWALVGDAGYLKDPSTGYGIGDALAQSFLLDEALAAWFGGAAWEESMGRFQRRRDEVMRPGYQLTLDNTRLQDPGTEVMGWVKAALVAPWHCRALAYELPRLLPLALSPHAFGAVAAVARAFGAAPSPAAEPARGVAP